MKRKASTYPKSNKKQKTFTSYNSRTFPKKRAPERKYNDVGTALDFDNAGTNNIVLLNGIAQGSDVTNRIGRRFNNVSIQMRYTIQTAPTTPVAAAARLMLVFDTQSNGAAPTILQILSSNSTQGPMNLDNRDRFKVIHDITHVVQPSGPEIVYEKYYKKINLETTNSGTTNTVSSIATGALYLLMIGDLVSSEAVGFAITRVRYTDD